MRTLLIFLSIGLFFTLVTYSNGASAKPVSSESEEDDTVQPIEVPNPKSDSERNDQADESDESDEITKQSKSNAIQVPERIRLSEENKIVGEVPELVQNLEEPYSHSADADGTDELSDVESIVNNDHRRILEDADEE